MINRFRYLKGEILASKPNVYPDLITDEADSKLKIIFHLNK